MGRPRNEGPLLRKRHGIWYATVYVGGRAVEHSTGERDREAAACVAAAWTQAGAPANRDAAQTTVDDAVGDLVDDRKAKVRAGECSDATVEFYERKGGTLLAFFGPGFRVSAWEKDSAASWDYIKWRRSSEVADRTIKKELGTLRTALHLAKEQGLFHGDPELAIPASFDPSNPVSERSPTRPEILKLIPHLAPDSAAVVAYILATGAEFSALQRARSSDLPAQVRAPMSVAIRGS